MEVNLMFITKKYPISFRQHELDTFEVRKNRSQNLHSITSKST
jgi:hypothetical protein